MKILLLFLLLPVFSYSQANAQDSNSLYKTADSLYRGGNYLRAKEAYSSVMSVNKPEAKVQLSYLYTYRSRCERKLNQYEEALKDINSAIDIYSKNGDAYWDRAILYSDLNKAELAIKDYTAAIPFYKNNDLYRSKVYGGRARQEYNLKDYESCIKDDSIAISIDPKNGDAYWDRGLAFKHIGNNERAINDFTASIPYQVDKENWASLYYNRGNCQQNLKSYLKAFNDYNRAIDLNPNDSLYYVERGFTYSKNGDYQLATDDFTKALSFVSRDTSFLTELYYNRARMQLYQKSYLNSITDISKAIELNSKRGSYYLLLGNIYLEEGEFKSSRIYYLKAVSLSQNNKKLLAVIYDAIANNDFMEKDYQSVIANSTNAITINPNSVSSYYYRARAQLNLRKNNKATSDLKRILALDDTKKTLEYIFSLHFTGDDDQAIKLMNERILLARTDYDKVNEYYNLACLYALTNKTGEANTYLKLAIDGGYSKKYALEDTDLENIRATEGYVKSLKNK